MDTKNPFDSIIPGAIVPSSMKKPIPKRGRPKSPHKKKKVNFTLSLEARKTLAETAKRAGISQSSLVERCIRCQLAGECLPCDPKP